MKRLLPTEELRESGREIEQQITAQVRNRPEVAAMLQQLEQRFDEHAKDHRARSLLIPVDQHIPDAEEIGSAVESYLSEHSEATSGMQNSATAGDEPNALAATHDTSDQVHPMRPSRAERDMHPDPLDQTSDDARTRSARDDDSAGEQE